MPLELSKENLIKLWDDREKERASRTKRKNYYDGKHAVLERKGDTYVDGVQKGAVVTNWTAFGIDQYTGALTDAGYQVSSDDDDSDTEDNAAQSPETDGPAIYEGISEENDLQAQDTENLRTALVHGVAVETHEFDDQRMIIRNSDPRNWVLLYDTDNDLVGAIYRIKLEPGTLHDNEVLEDDMELMTFYDDTEIVSYQKTGDEDWAEIDRRPHFYGMVPIVDWHVNDMRASFITDALITLQDEYNEIDSISGDNLRRFVNALLSLKPDEHDPDWMTKNLQKIKELGLIIGEAQFIHRQSDTQPETENLTRKREAIHTEMKTPDVAQIVGATGVTSGIALKLKFQPMQSNASKMIRYLKKGMRRRIALINEIQKRLQQPLIENVTVTIQFTLPVNRYEEWQAVSVLKGIVSHLKMLELLSDVDDPQKELERVRAEQDDLSFAGDPEEVAARQENIVANQAVELAPLIQQAIENLSEATIDFMLREGVIDRAIERERKAQEANV